MSTSVERLTAVHAAAMGQSRRGRGPGDGRPRPGSCSNAILLLLRAANRPVNVYELMLQAEHSGLFVSQSNNPVGTFRTAIQGEKGLLKRGFVEQPVKGKAEYVIADGSPEPHPREEGQLIPLTYKSAEAFAKWIAEGTFKPIFPIAPVKK